MGRTTLRVELENTRNAIRKHRDMKGDDRCHLDDGELYSILPEGDTRPIVETAVDLNNCIKYIRCRQEGREYISPQRRIEELEIEVERLRLSRVELTHYLTQTSKELEQCKAKIAQLTSREELDL